MFHTKEKWLAVADLHYGYEICQRFKGGLGPMWGIKEIEATLASLIVDYTPQRLVIVGDLIHATAAIAASKAFIKGLESFGIPLTLIAGNHDQHAAKSLDLVETAVVGQTLFSHGHLPTPDDWLGSKVIGHWHPSVTIRRKTGPRMRFPAFVRQGPQWILPAFSPWAAGVEWLKPATGFYACVGDGVLEIPRFQDLTTTRDKASEGMKCKTTP